jgi:hypothetical protein
MAFGTVCKNTETQENEAWIIAGPTDGSTNIVHHDNNNNYQLLTGVDDQYGAGYTGITSCCKPLFNPATGLLTVDCVCSTATCVDIDTLDNSGVNHPVLFQMYDAVNSELINKLGKSTSVTFNPNCYVCNDPDTGAQVCKPVLYVSTICSDEYLGIAEPISYVNSLPVKPENKIYGIQESDTITSMTVKTLARTYFDFDSTNNVYVPKQNLIETDLTIGLSTDVDIQTINSSFTEINGSITVTPETTASGTLTLQRFYAGESTSCNYFKLGSGDGGSGTVEINRQSYTGYKLVASDANGENLRISGPTVTADDQNFDITLSNSTVTLKECRSAARHVVCVGEDSTCYSSIEQQRGTISDSVEDTGYLNQTIKSPYSTVTTVNRRGTTDSASDITSADCKDIAVIGVYGCSQFKSTSDRAEIKNVDLRTGSTSSISTNVSSGSEPNTWIGQESYMVEAGTTKCIQTHLIPKCDKPLWSTYFVTDSSGADLNHSSVALCCDGKMYVNCDETKGWKCLLNEDDIPDATTICESDTNCDFPLTFYDYDNTTFLTSCNGKLTYNPGTNTVEMGSGVGGVIRQTSCQPVGNGKSTNELIFCEGGLFTMKQCFDCSSWSQYVSDAQISECEGRIRLYVHAKYSQSGRGSTTCADISGGYTHIDYNTGNNYCRVCGTHLENGAGMYLRTCNGMTSSPYGQTFRACVDPDYDCPNPESFSYSFCDSTRNSAFKLCNCDGKMYVNCDSTKGWKCLLNEDEASSGGTYISWTNPTTSCVNSLTTENSIVGQSYGSINLAIPGCSEFYADATCMTVDKKNIGSLQIRDNGVCLDSLGGTLQLDQSGNVTLTAKAGCPGGAVIANRFTSDGTAILSVGNGNELNITPPVSGATWINYRGGSTELLIGNGSGALGTINASYVNATLSGRINMACGYCATDCNFMPYSGTGGVYGMGEGEWAHFLTFAHGNFDSYYGSAIRVPFFDGDRWTWRTRGNGALNGVHELLDNRGNQAVYGAVCYSIGEQAAGTNLAFVKGSNTTAGAGFNGGAYLGHLNANYDGYWGFATVGYYNAETGALTPNICMAREGYVFFNNGISSTNAHVDTCVYGPYGKIDFATNNRIEIEPAAGSGGSVMWGPGQCSYFFLDGANAYVNPGSGHFIVHGTEEVHGDLLVCGTPYKFKNNAWCPLTSADEVVPVTTANGTHFVDTGYGTYFNRCYGGRVASTVSVGNDIAYMSSNNGTTVSDMGAGDACAYMLVESQTSCREFRVTPIDVAIYACGLKGLHFANGGCETTYQGMSMGNPNAFILANMAPQNIVIPVASTGSTDLGNGQLVCDYVGTLVVSDTCRALLNFAGIMGGQPVVGMYTYKATNINGTWFWTAEKGFTK